MAPPPRPTSRQSLIERPNKRRRQETLTEEDESHRTTNQDSDHDVYDPDQDVDERRRIRKGLRDLTKETQDLATEYVVPASNGLRDAIRRADELFTSVKQTSDATIDSRLLVTAGDLALKKTQQLVHGDGSQAIDIDEFVSKCIAFMKNGAGDRLYSSTQRRRANGQVRNIVEDDDAEDEEDVGDALDWEWLGTQACFPSNSRPPVPSFLLGPLSLQKRTRAPRARRERLQRNNAEEVRPQELQAADLERSDNNNLRKVVIGLHKHLNKTIREGEAKVNEEANEDMSEVEMLSLMHKHNVSDDGGVSLFRFAINPHSFGQTVENLFHVSFLIRDSLVCVEQDGNGLPTLRKSVCHAIDAYTDNRPSR